MTGIVQFLGKYGLDKLKDYCEDGYTFLKAYDKELKQNVALKVEKEDKNKKILKMEYEILQNLQGKIIRK